MSVSQHQIQSRTVKSLHYWGDVYLYISQYKHHYRGWQDQQNKHQQLPPLTSHNFNRRDWRNSVQHFRIDMRLQLGKYPRADSYFVEFQHLEMNTIFGIYIVYDD